MDPGGLNGGAGLGGGIPESTRYPWMSITGRSTICICIRICICLVGEDPFLYLYSFVEPARCWDDSKQQYFFAYQFVLDSLVIKRGTVCPPVIG